MKRRTEREKKTSKKNRGIIFRVNLVRMENNEKTG